MDNISQQIERLLRQQASEGENVVGRYKTSLDQANDQDEGGIEKAEALYSDRDKFTESPLNALAKGLMSGGHGGNFGGGIAEGLSGALDTQTANKKANLSREEKLVALESLKANLTRNRGTDQLNVFKEKNGLIEGLGGTQTKLADIELDNEVQTGKPGTPEEAAMRLLMDYDRNASKYAGPNGQAKVKNAMDIYKKMMTARNEAAKLAAKKKGNFTTVDKKAILEARASNVNLTNNSNNLQRALELGPKTWAGVAPQKRAQISTWLGAQPESYFDKALNFIGLDDAESGNNQVEYSQIMQGEAIKQMAETLKGATTDREMLKFIEIAADDSIAWGPAKEAAVKRVLAFTQLLMENNDETIKGVRDGTMWTGEGDPPADDSDELPTVTDDSDWEELEPGASYLDPQGNVRRKAE